MQMFQEERLISVFLESLENIKSNKWNTNNPTTSSKSENVVINELYRLILINYLIFEFI